MWRGVAWYVDGLVDEGSKKGKVEGLGEEEGRKGVMWRKKGREGKGGVVVCGVCV